jgi:hypothetical protein
VTVQYLSIKVRISSVASFFNADTSSQENTVNIDLGKSRNEGERRILWLYHFIPKPYIRIKLHGLEIRVEKAYLAPEIPDFCRSSTLPSPVVQRFDVSNLPTFEQESMVDW